MNHSERQHTKISPSGAARWINCPGSVVLTVIAPPQQPSLFAEEGTKAHEIAEYCLTHKIADPKSVQMFSEYPQDLLEAVRVYLEYVIPKLLTADLCGVEDTVTIPLGSMTIKGIVDAWVANDDTLEIIDYKHGAGVVVEPKNNYQLMLYAHGLLKQLPKALSNSVRTVVLTIVQPRAPHADGYIRSWEADPADFVDLVTAAMTAADKIIAGDETLNPGKWCRFCPALPVCPAVAREAEKKAREEFAANRILGPEEVGRLLQWAEDVLEPWINSMRGYVLDELENGAAVPGWKLVERRAVRKWASEEAVIEWARKQRLRQSDIFEKRLINPAQMEKLVGRGRLPAELVVKQSSGKTIAREIDPRPEVSSERGDEFFEGE